MKKGMKNQKENIFDKSYEEMRDFLRSANRSDVQYAIDHFKDRPWKNDQEMHAQLPALPAMEDPTHKMPYSRREFLRDGLLGTTLTLTAPTLISSTANALICPDGGAAANKRLPLLVIDCSAGASFLGVNVMVGRTGPNDPLAAGGYAAYGLPANQEPGTVAPRALFGTDSMMRFHNRSIIADNIALNATQALLDKTDGLTIACASVDDTTNNVLNISQAIVQAGIRGELAGAVGSRNSASGGRSQSLLASASTQATQVQDQNQAAGLVNPGDLSVGLGNSETRVSYVLRQVASLTESQSNAITSPMVDQSKKDVISCGAVQNITNLSGKNFSQMYNTPIVQSAYATPPTNGVDMAMAAGVYLALTGEVSAATVEIGGCDYHAISADQQAARDADVGRLIGKAITMANAAGSPIMIYLISDGSASARGAANANNNLFRQQDENGNYASTNIFVFSPTVRPTVVKPQFGEFTANGVLQDGTYAWATSPSTAAQLAALNYLFLANRTGDFGVLGTLPMPASELIGFGAPVVSTT